MYFRETESRCGSLTEKLEQGKLLPELAQQGAWQRSESLPSGVLENPE